MTTQRRMSDAEIERLNSAAGREIITGMERALRLLLTIPVSQRHQAGAYDDVVAGLKRCYDSGGWGPRPDWWQEEAEDASTERPHLYVVTNG